MSEPDVQNQIRDLRSIEYASAQASIENSRELLRRAAKRIRDTASSLVEADSLDLIEFAHELTLEAAHLRKIAVELNSATALVGEHVAHRARMRGIEA